MESDRYSGEGFKNWVSWSDKQFLFIHTKENIGTFPGYQYQQQEAPQ